MIFALGLTVHTRPTLKGAAAWEINFPGGFFVMGSYERCIGIGLLPRAMVVAQAATMNVLTVALQMEVPIS
jgi:hypothetical protein